MSRIKTDLNMTDREKIFANSIFKSILAVYGIDINMIKGPDDIVKILGEAKYYTTREIALKVFLAWKTDKPILIEGPPGVGKTYLAESLANALKIHDIAISYYRIQCYEGITPDRVIGNWNFQKQILDLQILTKTGKIQKAEELMEKIRNTEEYFNFGKLCLALLDKNDVVMLIDEIDKADPEFEYVLLEFLGEKKVTLPEFKEPIISTKKDKKITIFITSNATRTLSDTLLRRCLYLYLPYPDLKTEYKIVMSHLNSEQMNLKDIEKFVANLIALANLLRTDEEFKGSIERPPSTAELIDFIIAVLTLHSAEIGSYAKMDAFLDLVKDFIGYLVKTQPDNEKLLQHIAKNLEAMSEKISKIVPNIYT